jgi:uncharacterized membrane protein (DUF106 family)
MNNCVKVDACAEAEDMEGTKKRMKEYSVDYFHEQESRDVSTLERDLCETNNTDLRDPRQILEVDLKKLIMCIIITCTNIKTTN